jgi:hypothetical protein
MVLAALVADSLLPVVLSPLAPVLVCFFPQMHSLGSALVVVSGLLAGAEYILNDVVLLLENVTISSCCVERPYLHQMCR